MTSERGFTFIELVLVIVMIGILASVAAQKMISVAEDAELAAEDSTADILRNNLTANVGEDLIKGRATRFPDDPFINLNKVPEGYDRRRVVKPTGVPADDGIWLFVSGSATGNLTPEQAGTTLTNFRVTGFIYHQRRDHTVVKWPYDSVNGVIGSKIVELESDLKKRLDTERQLRGEETERERMLRMQRQGIVPPR